MKMKRLAFVGIVVLLCSLFLVALPVVVAEDDFVLGVYGNANEDDTIDMRDLTYVKLIFFGEKSETEFADAKYDGKINPLDFVQIKLIIVGKEEELTVLMYTRTRGGSTDITEVPVTVRKPIERIVPIYSYPVPVMRSLKLEKDRIVGVVKNIKEANTYFPEFSELPMVSSKDYESILNLHPDLVIVDTSNFEEKAEKLPGVTVVAFDCWRPDTHVDEIRRLGYILDKEDEAEKFIEFYREVLDTSKETVDKIPEEDRPKVYFESWSGPYRTGAKGSGFHEKVTMAGGNNIFGDRSGYFSVDPEEVMKRNPEIIVKYPRIPGSRFLGTDVTELIDVKNEITNRPELAEVEAVKNEKVYIILGDVIGTARHFVGMVYMAKWFYPELFEDLDPKAIHQEYLTRFQGLPDDFLDTHGAFVYPEESVCDKRAIRKNTFF